MQPDMLTNYPNANEAQKRTWIVGWPTVIPAVHERFVLASISEPESELAQHEKKEKHSC
jgi:hypothetical protein